MTWNPDELRVIGAVAPMLLKMIEQKEQAVWVRLHGEYKSGKTDFLAGVAEFSALRDQKNEITAALRQLEKGNVNG